MKIYENILIYYVLYKTLIGAKHLHIMFDNAGEFIRDYAGIKYSAIFSPKKYDCQFW